jgi:DNA-binding NarL/FixJ family response regulator
VSNNLLPSDVISTLEFVFPELSKKQIEVVAMFSSGVGVEDIALSRHASVTSTKKLLNRAMKAFDVYSMQSLRSIFQTRLAMFSLQKNVLISKQVTRIEQHISQQRQYHI